MFFLPKKIEFISTQERWLPSSPRLPTLLRRRQTCVDIYAARIARNRKHLRFRLRSALRPELQEAVQLEEHVPRANCSVNTWRRYWRRTVLTSFWCLHAQLLLLPNSIEKTSLLLIVCLQLPDLVPQRLLLGLTRSATVSSARGVVLGLQARDGAQGPRDGVNVNQRLREVRPEFLQLPEARVVDFPILGVLVRPPPCGRCRMLRVMILLNVDSVRITNESPSISDCVSQ